MGYIDYSSSLIFLLFVVFVRGFLATFSSPSSFFALTFWLWLFDSSSLGNLNKSTKSGGKDGALKDKKSDIIKYDNRKKFEIV